MQTPAAVKRLTAEDYIKQGLSHEQKKEFEQARECYEQAGKSGSARGWANLATLYYQGKGGKVDSAQAYQCYMQALQIDENHLRSHYMLAKMLAKGDGIKQNIEAGLLHYAFCAKHHYQDSLTRYAELKSTLPNSSPSSVEDDQSLSHPHFQGSVQKIPFAQISLSKRIGAGAFGEVCLGKWQGESVAVKKLRSSSDSRELLDEAAVLYRLNSPRVVRLYGISLDQEPTMVMEFVSRGNLIDLLQKETLSWSVKVTLGSDIGMGLGYLHENGVLHRDLKAANIFVDHAYRAKLGDLGLGKIKIGDNTTQLNVNPRVRGTTNSLAPEILFSVTRPTHTPKTDIYSYGMTLWEIATEKEPTEPYTQQVNLEGVIYDPFKRIPSNTPAIFLDEIQKCWKITPKDRPDAYDVAAALDRYEEEQDLVSSTGLGLSDQQDGLYVVEDKGTIGYLEYAAEETGDADKLRNSSDSLFYAKRNSYEDSRSSYHAALASSAGSPPRAVKPLPKLPQASKAGRTSSSAVVPPEYEPASPRSPK